MIMYLSLTSSISRIWQTGDYRILLTWDWAWLQRPASPVHGARDPLSGLDLSDPTPTPHAVPVLPWVAAGRTCMQEPGGTCQTAMVLHLWPQGEVAVLQSYSMWWVGHDTECTVGALNLRHENNNYFSRWCKIRKYLSEKLQKVTHD